MHKEYGALINNGTWKLVDPLFRTKPIFYKWVFMSKYKLDESLGNNKVGSWEKDLKINKALIMRRVFPQ